MILRIVGFGHPSLRRKNEELPADYEKLDELIFNMFETMYKASGVGLAAPQVDIPFRVFVVDGEPMDDLDEEGESMEGFKKVFINPQMLEESGIEWGFEEGCLSIPDIREPVKRKPRIRIRYEDINRVQQEETFEGLKARIIQHEYDHLEGKLFTDHLSGLRRKMLKSKLNRIAKGDVDANYPMKFKL